LKANENARALTTEHDERLVKTCNEGEIQMSYTPMIVTRKPLKCKRLYRSKYRKLAPLRTWKQEFDAGQSAFHRGVYPKPGWSKAKNVGWDFAGEQQYLACVENDGIGSSESEHPFLW
jgi:hypothetical protein